MEAEDMLVKLRVLISKLDAILLYLLGLRKSQGILDKVEKQILETRTKAALSVEELKRELDLPIHCPEREAQELADMKQIAASQDMQLTETEIEEYFTRIFAASGQAQEKQRRAAT